MLLIAIACTCGNSINAFMYSHYHYKCDYILYITCIIAVIYKHLHYHCKCYYMLTLSL